MTKRLLIIEDEDILRESLKRVLTREGYVVETVSSAESALNAVDEGFYDLILTDIILPGITGIELLKRIKERFPDQIVVIMTAFASLETAVDALRNGAYDYIVKPVMHEEIKQVVKNAIMQGILQEENNRLRNQIEREYSISSIIGQSPAMKMVIEEIKEIAAGDSNVFIVGESGTGKELISRLIHSYSKRADSPFIPVNVRAIHNDIESRLFGCIKGITGAPAPRKGMLEEANGGTVFFKEINDINDELMTKIKNTMISYEISPVGSSHPIKIDIRYIFASRSIVRQDVIAGMDFVRINIPPLRERREDIPHLANFFRKRYSEELCKEIKSIDDDAMDMLVNYQWPGNIRELRNIIERAVLLSDGDTIGAEHILLRLFNK